MRINHASSIAMVLAAAAAIACGGGSGNSATAPAATLASIAVTAPVSTIAIGGTTQLTAAGKDQNGNPISATVTWASSNPAVATVNASGIVTGMTAGTATITATSGSVIGTTAITVSATLVIPLTADVTMPANTFSPLQVDIQQGGTVRYIFPAEAHNVLFNGAAGAPADIQVTANAVVPRTFGAKGTFNYVCTLHVNMTGTVVVH